MVGVLAGLAYPLIDVAVACAIPDSEACVWGKAYWPLNVALGIGLIGSFVGIVLYVAWSHAVARRAKRPHGRAG